MFSRDRETSGDQKCNCRVILGTGFLNKAGKSHCVEHIQLGGQLLDAIPGNQNVPGGSANPFVTDVGIDLVSSGVIKVLRV